MKITQLVATKRKTPYHESVASRLPRGIKTQQQLFNLGYRIAVEDLGLAKAKTLNENFATNLVNSFHNRMLNEGVGSFLGKMAGNVVGGAQAAGRGLKSAWNDAKAGYDAAKSGWDPQAPGAAPAAPGAAPAAPAPGADRPYVAPAGGVGSAPSPGGATPTPPAAGTPPKTSSGGIGDIMKAIDGLDLAGKKQLAGEVDKLINTPPPAAEKPADAAAPPAPGAAPAKPAPLPQATPAQGAYSVKSAYAQPTPAAPAAATPAAPQFKGPKVNGLQVRNMGEGKKLKFRSNFLDMDL